MKNKILKTALALMLLLSVVFCFASCGAQKVPEADDAEGKIDETDISWEYDADDKTLTVKGTGSIPDFDASEDVPWYAVRHSVEEIEIAEGITYIGDYAFYYCPMLTDVEIPASVGGIGDFAFAFCSSLKGLEIPDGVTSVGEGCFEACRLLEGIYLPASVTSLGARAFAHCSSMKEAVIMAQITSIDTWTFMGCRSLEKLCFYKSAGGISVADDAFEGANIGFEKAVFADTVEGEFTLTVDYVYEDGSEAAAAHTETLKYGDPYSVTSPTLEGYTASELTVSGEIYKTENFTVTYVANEVESETEAETEAVADTPEEKKGVDVGTVIAIVIFAVVIIAIIVLVIVMMRSDKKQTNGTQRRTQDTKNEKNNKKKKK